jgi:hypothetical protein
MARSSAKRVDMDQATPYRFWNKHIRTNEDVL